MTFNRLTGTALLSALALWMLPCAADQASSITLSADENHEHEDEGHLLANDEDGHEKDGDHGELLADDDHDDEHHDKELA